MSLLMPDTGLLFWMLLSFGIVVGILCKYGFPVILKSVEERKASIDRSLDAARRAEEQLAGLQAEGAVLLTQAKEQQAAILKEATAAKEQILAQAHAEAEIAHRRLLEKAAHEIGEEKQKAIREIRGEIASLSVDIAEKILREKMADSKEQQAAVNRLLNEMTVYKS